MESKAKHVRSVDWGDGEKGNVELYLGKTYITFTGTPLDSPLPLRQFSQQEIAELKDELFPKPEPEQPNAKSRPEPQTPPVSTSIRDLSDRELRDRAHRTDADFWKYWNGHPGTLNDGSRSGIRYAMLLKLAFSCGSDEGRARRIAESSPFYASLDDQGKADWARLFSKEYRKAQGQNRNRFGENARYQPRSHGRRTKSGGNKPPLSPTEPDLSPDEQQQRVGSDESSPTPDLLNFQHNDYGNRERLLALHGHDLRYSPTFKRWLIWDDRRWAVDDENNGAARDKAIETMLEYQRQALEADDDKSRKFASSCLDLKRIASMLAMAQHPFHVAVSQLDRDPWLLNFQNGTVDLRTSELRSHRREDFITKLIPYDYEPDASCFGWLQFLEKIMGGGADADEAAQQRAWKFIDYLQRATGYSFTGVTSEKVVFMPYGEGNTGKTTFLSVPRELAGEYGTLLQVDTLMTRQESNNTQADLADLRGARFVQTSEAEEGQRLAQGKLKRITQGMGDIKATRKYENPVIFKETHKLWIDTNRKPIIRDAGDRATFNRLHPIPFTVVIPEDEIDKELPKKLIEHEAVGILAWAVAGAKLWCASGLKRPKEVDEAREAYRAENDQIGRFINECCVRGDAFTVKIGPFYSAYKSWCENSSEKPEKSNNFGRIMTEQGFTRDQSGKKYQGIGLCEKRDQDD